MSFTAINYLVKDLKLKTVDELKKIAADFAHPQTPPKFNKVHQRAMKALNNRSEAKQIHSDAIGTYRNIYFLKGDGYYGMANMRVETCKDYINAGKD